MTYSELLAQQERERELLNQQYYADHATIREMQQNHYDKSRFDGQLERLQADFERKSKEMDIRFKTEQRTHLNEPDMPEPEHKLDISESQDKAAAMMQDYKKRQADGEKKNQDSDQQGRVPTKPTSKPDEAEVKKMAQQMRQDREQKQQQRRRGFKR